jgi:hypothetical protein
MPSPTVVGSVQGWRLPKYRALDISLRHKQDADGAPLALSVAVLVALRFVFHAFMPRMFIVAAMVFAIVIAFAIPFFARFTTASLVNDAYRVGCADSRRSAGRVRELGA